MLILKKKFCDFFGTSDCKKVSLRTGLHQSTHSLEYSTKKHRWTEIMELTKNTPDQWWTAYCPVTCIQTGPVFSVLEQLAESIKGRRHQKSYIKYILFHKLYGKRQWYHHFCILRAGRKSLKSVRAAIAWNGGRTENTKSATMQTIISVAHNAVCLYTGLIGSLGATMNENTVY